MEYRDTGSATDGADKVLELAEELKDKGELLNGAKLGVTVLEEMIDLLDCCDDSDGYVGGIIGSAMELLNELTDAGDTGYTDAEKLFDIIFHHAQNEIYDGWSDWRMALLDACVPLCKEVKLRKRLEEYLSDLQSHGSKEDYNSRYIDKTVQQTIYELISRFDGQENADAYIELHIENSDFREIAIKKAIEYNYLDRALALCLGGEQMDAQYAGLVSTWKKLRYVVYELQCDLDSQKNLATQFALDGSMEYYHKLKAMYTAEEWPAVLQALLEKMEYGRARHNTYIEILIQEGLKLRLMAYCRQTPSSVTRLYPHLLLEFQTELDEIFNDYILCEAANASSRSHYHNICGVIKHYTKACGKQNANVIKEELMAKYLRRPAFLDELNKMKA